MKRIDTKPPTRLLATLCLLVGGTATPARAHFFWSGIAPGTPPQLQVRFTEEPGEARADPRAYALLKAAHDSRQTLPAEFPGFTAEVVLDDNGRVTTGTMSYTPGEGVDLKIEGATEEAARWLRGALGNAIGHRRGGDFARGDGRHPLSLGPDDRHPLGRQVLLNDAFRSSYRVRDNTVTEVARTMGDQRFVITVLETEKGDGRKYLPRHFVVTYFDAATGAIREVQSFSDRHAKIKGAWLPTSRRVITAADGRVIVRRFELRDVRLLARRSEKP